MKTVRDLRLPHDRIDLGTALRPIIAHFMPGTEIPLGPTWDAFDELLSHLEREAFDRVGMDAQAGFLARLGARLLGLQGVGRVPLGAEDVARLEGQRQAFRAVRRAVIEYVLLSMEPARQERTAPAIGRPPLAVGQSGGMA